MEIQTDQGLLVLNLENVQALHQMSKGDCIYTLALANNENDAATMVQIPVSLQCNRNSINFQPAFNNDHHVAQQTANVHQYTQQHYDQVQIAEQLQCLLQSNDEISMAAMKPLNPHSTFITIAPGACTLDEQDAQTNEELPVVNIAPAECELEVDHQAIYNYIDSNLVPNFASDKYIKTLKKRSRNYSIINKTLYHGIAKLRKVVVGTDAQEKMLKESHIVKETGVHLGVNKMYAAITASYFWKELYSDVTNHVRQCEGCSERLLAEPTDQREDESRQPSTPQATPNVSQIWQTVEAQMHGPFTKTTQGHDHLLTISDPASRWIVALPITSNEISTQMANFIFETFCMFGFASCQVVSSSVASFAVVQDVYQERASVLAEATRDLCCGETRLCGWAEDLISGLVADFPDDWDRELAAFLFKFCVTDRENGSPFAMMFHRSGKNATEEKENRESSQEREFGVGTRKRRRLQSSILQCRHCEEAFTSKISFRIHQRKHTIDARRRGILEGQEASGVLLDSDTKLLSNGSGKKKKLVKQNAIANRLDRLLANRNNDFRANQQKPLPKDDRDELKANTVAAVRDMLALTKDERRKRGRYHKFPPEIQEEMARHALRHGNMSAVNHFSEKLGCVVTESSVRNIVKANQKFSLEMREEIGRYAMAFGVEACSSLYSESMGTDVRRSLVRKFQNEFMRRYPAVESNPEAAHTNVGGADGKEIDSHLLNLEEGCTKSSGKKRHHKIFTPKIREEIGSYALQFSVSDTIQHFASRFLLKKSTVVKYRKMCLENAVPLPPQSSVVQETTVPSTSQTINILNASLSLLNNPQLNNTPASSMYGSLYPPLATDHTSTMQFPLAPTADAYSQPQQANPMRCYHNQSPFNQNTISDLSLESAQNDFVTFNSLQHTVHKTKADSLFAVTTESHFGDGNILYSSGTQRSMTPLTVVSSSSTLHSSSRPACGSGSPTPLFILPDQQVVQIPHDKQDYHKLIDSGNPSQISFDLNCTKDNMPAETFLPILGVEVENNRCNALSEFDTRSSVGEIRLHCSTDAEFTAVANADTSRASRQQINSKSAEQSKASSQPQHKQNQPRTDESDEDVDDPDSESDCSIAATAKKRGRSLQKRKKIDKKEVAEKRGAYTMYSPEIRARMGKYAVEHGNQRTCKHFGSLLGHLVPESTVRGLRDKYLLKREQLSSAKNTPVEVKSLGYFPRGRPTRLGKYDELVQDCIRELTKSGEKVTTALVIATARQVLSRNDPSLLEENGGTTTLTVTWAKSFLKRIGARNNS